MTERVQHERFTISGEAPNNPLYAERRFGVWDAEANDWAVMPNATYCWGMHYDTAADCLNELRGGMRAEALRDG